MFTESPNVPDIFWPAMPNQLCWGDHKVGIKYHVRITAQGQHCKCKTTYTHDWVGRGSALVNAAKVVALHTVLHTCTDMRMHSLCMSECVAQQCIYIHVYIRTYICIP